MWSHACMARPHPHGLRYQRLHTGELTWRPCDGEAIISPIPSLSSSASTFQRSVRTYFTIQYTTDVFYCSPRKLLCIDYYCLSNTRQTWLINFACGCWQKAMGIETGQLLCCGLSGTIDEPTAGQCVYMRTGYGIPGERASERRTIALP